MILKIFKVLNLEMKRNHNLNLIIVAEANFLGKIKSHFKSKSKKSRVEWVEKDLKRIPQNKWYQLIGLNELSNISKISS